MKTGTVGIKEIVSGYQYRVKPNTYLVEGKRIFAKLKARGVLNSTVADYTDTVFRPGIFKRIFVKSEQFGRPYLTAQAVLCEDPRKMAKPLSIKHTANLDYMAIHKNDILVSCAGTIGNVRLIGGFLNNYIGSQDIIRAVSKDIYGFLYAYLSTSHVYKYLQAQIYGSVVPRIEPENVRDIPVPSFSPDIIERVNSLIIKSQDLRDSAIAVFDTAVNKFETLLCKSNYRACCRTQVTSSKMVSGRFTRFDAQYQIGTNELSKEIHGTDTVKVGRVAKNIYVGNRGKRNYVKHGIPFLSSSDMILFNPIKFSTLISVKTPNLEGLLVHTDDILISRSGTVGNTVIVSETLNGKAVSEHALRLVIDPDKMDPKYVFCYLNTSHGKRVLESLAYGSVIITLGEESVANIDLPLLPQEAKDEISAKIGQYSTLLDEATRLENEAVSLVETEIDKWN